ncbi:cache domain-containing protein, partial [Streptomyces parvus]
SDGSAGARPPGRFRGGARGPLVLTAVLLLLWCVPVGLLLNRTDGTVSIPAVMVNDQRDRTDLVADRARRALNEAQADLVSTSRLLDVDDPAGTETVLKNALREHTRYQALYVVGANGDIVARAGGDTHPWSAEKDPSLVRVSGQGEKRPVVQAGAPVPERKGMTLVGEVRVEFLNSLLKRPGLGEVRIVNADARTLAASDGFRAFEGLPKDALPDLVRAANVRVGAGPLENGLLIRDGGAVTVAAAAPFTGGGIAADLGWTVVSWQDAGRFEITAYEREDRSVLASLLGIALIVVCLGWIHLVVVRPLRALAAAAEKLADGDLKTVHYPRYQDEVGAVVRSLELIRQQLQARRQTQARRPAETRPGAGGR